MHNVLPGPTTLLRRPAQVPGPVILAGLLLFQAPCPDRDCNRFADQSFTHDILLIFDLLCTKSIDKRQTALPMVH